MNLDSLFQPLDSTPYNNFINHPLGFVGYILYLPFFIANLISPSKWKNFEILLGILEVFYTYLIISLYYYAKSKIQNRL